MVWPPTKGLIFHYRHPTGNSEIAKQMCDYMDETFREFQDKEGKKMLIFVLQILIFIRK